MLSCPEKPPAARAGPGGPRTLRSDELLRGEREVAIVHGDETYRLRLTSTGKLILTK